jgi:drug/metabolite transporter (DMT)-like permease
MKQQGLSPERLGYVCALTSAACFGSLSVLVKMAYGLGMDALTLLSLRLTLAAVFLWFIVFARFRHEAQVGWRGAGSLFLIGPLGSAFPATAYFLALRDIDASLGIALFYTFPLLTNLLGIVFLRDRPTRSRWFSLALTLMGIALAVELHRFNPARSDMGGIGLALVAAFFVAVFNLIVQPATQKHKPFIVNTYIITASAVLLSLLRPPWEFAQLDPRVWLFAAVIALLSTVIAMSLYLTSIRLIGAGRASVLSTFEPVVTITLAFMLLGEHLTFLQLVGVGAILLGIVIL